MKKISLYLAVVAALLCGCAVMTVDVDVYKGPLANTEEIQGEQVISLAMGAKPLLVQLRDRLEVAPGRYGNRKTKGTYQAASSHASAIDAALRKLRTSPHYGAAYMAVGKDDEGHVFSSELAIRVNEILGLYEDLGTPEVVSTVEEARALINQYRMARDLLEPDTNKEWLKRWAQWKKDLDVPKDDDLVEWYDQFFAVQRGEKDEKKRWRSKTPVMDPDKRTNEFKKKEGYVLTGIFEQMRDQVAAEDARKLFGAGDSASKTQFVTSVKSISDSYLVARNSLRKLMRLLLISLAEIELPTNKDLENRVQIKRLLAQASAPLISKAKIEAGVKKSEASMTAANATILKKLGQTPEREYRAELSEALETTPGLAEALLDMDAALMEDEKTYWGLTVGPVNDIQQTGDLVDDGDLEGVLAKFGKWQGPLDGGRLSAGIETSIEEYLAAAQKLPDTSQRLTLPEAQKLLAGLVAFGQKVAQLGNSIVLIDDSSNARQYIVVLQSVGNSILVHADELKQQAIYHQKLREAGPLTAETLLIHTGLQKTGLDQWKTNGLSAKAAIKQVEAVLRADYIKAQVENKKEPAASSISSATIKAPGAASIKAEISSELRISGATNVVRSSKTVTNNPPANAEIQLGNMTNTINSPDPGGHLRRAIEAVAEIHEGLIYLRPASAYLRSSYPAASLGKPSSQRSQNMLERAGWRSFPVVGSLVDGIKHEELKTFLEIDAQSWQNINRIKISGAGNVNHVVAKDDVGNWYVKQYGAERTAIYNSMRNVAMFSAGNAFGGPLPLRSAGGDLLLRTNPVLRTQLDAAESVYLKDLTNLFNTLSGNASNIVDSVKRSAASNSVTIVDPFLKKLSEAAEKLHEETSTIAKTITSAQNSDRRAKAEEGVVQLAYKLNDFARRAEAQNPPDNVTKQAIRDTTLRTIESALKTQKAALTALREKIAVIQTGAD
jgi:hypothetical protein